MPESSAADEYEYRLLMKQTLRRRKTAGPIVKGDIVTYRKEPWLVVEILPPTDGEDGTLVLEMSGTQLDLATGQLEP